MKHPGTFMLLPRSQHSGNDHHVRCRFPARTFHVAAACEFVFPHIPLALSLIIDAHGDSPLCGLRRSRVPVPVCFVPTDTDH